MWAAQRFDNQLKQELYKNYKRGIVKESLDPIIFKRYDSANKIIAAYTVSVIDSCFP